MPDESAPRVGVEVRSVSGSGDPCQIDNRQASDWSYRQSRRGNADRRYVGQVAFVGGTEGGRVRSDLAMVVADLLTWAADEQRKQGDRAE